MKKITAFFIAVFIASLSFSQSPCVDGMAGIYPCSHVDLLAFMPLSDIGSPANTNDVWGWVSPVSGKEYALVGCSNGTAFVDISNPVAPVYLGKLPTHTVNSLWRDIETYNNYCFIGSEAAGHGLQIFDLMLLDAVTTAPVTFTESAYYGGFGKSHTITINPQTGFCYCSGTNTFEGGLHIVDISNPMNPVLAGGFAADGYTHDCYVWSYDGPDASFTGKELVFACNEDELTVVDVTDKTDCFAIGSYDYGGSVTVGYIHQGWVTKDKSHFLIDDELDEMNLGNNSIPYGTRTHIFDIENLTDVQYVGFYEGTSTAIDHNLYVKDQFVYESNYRSGVRVLDAVHVSEGTLHEVGFFDLFPANDFAQFSGTWSNYPYLPSGVNLATSMYNGFFILKPTIIALSQSTWDLCATSEIIFNVQVNGDLAFPLNVGIQGLPGATVVASQLNEPGIISVTISGLNTVSSGNYYPDLLLQTNFGENYAVPFDIHVANGLAVAPLLQNVPDNAFVSNTATSTLFEWSAIETSTAYQFEISANEEFTSIIETQSLAQNLYLMTFTLPDGVYFWRVKSLNDCGESPWSTTFQFTVTVVGVNEVSKHDLRIYPNPAEDFLSIASDQIIRNISVSDLSGRIVFNRLLQNGVASYRLETTSLSPGIYMLNVDGKVKRFAKH